MVVRSPKVRVRVTAMAVVQAPSNEAREEDAAAVPARLKLTINVATLQPRAAGAP